MDDVVEEGGGFSRGLSVMIKEHFRALNKDWLWDRDGVE